MNKITVEFDYQKFDTFGRTICNAEMSIYEDEDAPLDCEENKERVVKAVRKLFTSKNLFDQCATFYYRNTDTTPFSERTCTGRIYNFYSDGYYKVIFTNANESKTVVKELKHATKADILDLYMNCVNRAIEHEHSFQKL